MRDIPYRNLAREPRKDKNGNVDPDIQRKYQRKLATDLRADLSLIDSTTPDTRDNITFTTDGQPRQTVNHGKKYVPAILGAPSVVVDSNDVFSIHQYKDASRTSLFLRVSKVDATTSLVTDAPKGVKITVFLHPKDG